MRVFVMMLMGIALLCAIRREARHAEFMCVRPSKTLVSGHEAYPSMCPKSHPFAFGGTQEGTGGKCCKTDSISKPISGVPLTETCGHDNYIACPGEHPCMSYDSTVVCDSSTQES